jgi:hypothetical protein
VIQPTVLQFTEEHDTPCGPEQFACQPGECVFSMYVCDGEPDCSNSQDETDCLRYTSLYTKESGFKLQAQDESKGNVTEEDCARMCAQSKRCTCTSFSYNSEKKRCLLGNRHTPFDSLLERKAWNYYSINGTIDNGCNRVKRPAHEYEGSTCPNWPISVLTVSFYAMKRNATKRNATKRYVNATQRNATLRNATLRNATLRKHYATKRQETLRYETLRYETLR